MGLPHSYSLDNEDAVVYYDDEFYTWEEAVNNNIILDFVYGWDSADQKYISSDTFDPGYGYWMYAYDDCILLNPYPLGQSQISLDNPPEFSSSEEFGWDVKLDFTEDSGESDYAYFGEKSDALDGLDSYDAPKSPPKMEPYIRAWFDSGLTEPYEMLWNDYRYYPDVYKVWNLSVQWVPSDYISPTTVTITWNAIEVGESEYDSVVLYDVGSGTIVADMLIDTDHTFPCPALILQQFQIICNKTVNYGQGCTQGTQITMGSDAPGGITKNIEDIEVGEHILSYDPINRIIAPAEVIRVYEFIEHLPEYYLIFNDNLEVTPKHTLYINGIEWMEADDAQIGYFMLGNIPGTLGTYPVPIFSKVEEPLGPTIMIYDLEIQPLVGEARGYWANGILVGGYD